MGDTRRPQGVPTDANLRPLSEYEPPTRPPADTDLVAFLRVRLDEREQRARSSRRTRRPGAPECEIYVDHDVITVSVEGGPAELLTSDLQDRLFEPAEPDRYELADIDAKRRIIDMFEQYAHGTARVGDVTTPGLPSWLNGGREALDRVLRLLAEPYADHPDYRPEWRP